MLFALLLCHLEHWLYQLLSLVIPLSVIWEAESSLLENLHYDLR